MNKDDLALNNQQWFICHKTKPNPTKSIFHIVSNIIEEFF